jgi:acetolactate synthase-1/2/3 large subunit
MNKSLKKLIENLGIEYYFTVTGGAIAPFVDAASDRVIFFQHEQSAVMAAEGYYRSSGKIAAVLVTSGPGIQNTLNGVCGCWYDSIPCLVISGQVNTTESLESITSKPRQVGFQEMPVVDIFKKCTVFCEKISVSSDVSRVFSSAMNTILNDRKGPAVIDFPVNIQMSEFDSDIKFIEKTKQYKDILIDLNFKNFKRPLVIVGNGSRDCKNLENWINVPFVKTWAAKDLFISNELCFGCHGVYGNRLANFALQNADLLIILGSRFDTRQTGGNLSKCSSYSTRIMVDIDEHEINKLCERGFEINYKLVNTVENFINSHKLECDCEEWIKTLKNINISEKYTGNVYRILKNINIPDDVIVIPDCGGNLVWAMQTIDARRIFTNLGNSSMGYSLPASIGAAIGSKTSRILCIIGDGGIQMNIQELYTIKKLNLPITILVLNNGGYGIIRQFQNTYMNGRHIAVDMNINIGKIAQAYDIPVSYEECINISNSGPLLYDVKIDYDQTIIPKLDFGNSLENMTPYNQEIIDNMIVEKHEYISSCGWRTI